ncbi:MAG: cobalamin-5-phosphate synthase CobS, partial [Frankiales bacterium]|nr:cobalamin-5-phosphate synthase CobS [Frankiales bacterium]
AALVVGGAAAYGVLADDPLRTVPAVLAGLAAAWLLLRHAVRRLGGLNGDVLGALVETTTTVVLVAMAVGT